MTALQIFVQSEGTRGIRILELSAHATVRDLVGATSRQGQSDAEGRKNTAASVYIEDADHALSLDDTLEAAGLGNQSSVHVSHCSRIAVTVHYNGKERAESFAPGVPMHRVKQWAVGKQAFDLAAIDAAEHVLQLTDSQERPDEDIHIGSVAAASGCVVEFDLVPKVRVEG
jgi:hypothetical protein